MSFWQGGAVLDLLLVLSALALAYAARRWLPGISRLSVPDAMWAGLGLMLLGPTGLGLLSFDPDTLETLVYHALAVVFLAIALRSPGPRGGAGTRGVAIAVPFLSALQAVIGIGLALLLGQHPGVGALLAYAFEQGPGQALSIGAAWESSAGVEEGGQIGLIMAALGFGWCFLLGVPLVHLGRRLGWAGAHRATGPALQAPEQEAQHTDVAGGLEPLTVQLAALGALYLLTFAALQGLAWLLSFDEHLAAMVWGFHFVVAMVVALLARKLLVEVAGQRDVLDDTLLTRVASSVVDLATAAALGAVRLDVAAANALPLLLITGVGAVLTALACVWAARRVFQDDPLGHALALYGTATGTLPTGLALLRAHDPELQGPAASNMVLGSAASIPFAAPIYLFLLPYAALGVPGARLSQALIGLALLVAVVLLMLLMWRYWAGMRLLRPLWHPWPPARSTGEPS